jgi:glycosyltransferase involved in cell wall biosynthesis/ribosomal protein S18 acetylase RimI-like enzyme
VAHVTTTDISLELLLGPQLEAFARAGYDVVGVSAAGPFVPALEARGIRHVPLRYATRSWAPMRDARALGDLVEVFRELRPAIVHTHNPKPGFYGRLAARIARVPVIVNTVHGLYALPEDRLRKRAAVYALERIGAACSHAELVQNEEDLAVLRRLGVPTSRVRFLGNGIDLTRFTPSADAGETAWARAELGAGRDGVLVGVVGRLVREKGIDDVVAAAERLRGHTPEITFVVVGEADPARPDSMTASDRERAESVGVRFAGFRGDVHRLYRGMDVFVLASRREGFPRAAMEAAASGLPVVATDVRGCRQVVQHGVTGLLVPPRDPDALARAVADLADDARLRARLGAAAARRARYEFDQQRVIATTLDTYARLLPGDASIAGRMRRAVDASPVGGPRPATLDDVPGVVALHQSRIADGFLTSLGPAFLARLYSRIVRSPLAALYVSGEPGALDGFAAVTADTGALYRSFILRDGLPVIPSVLRRSVTAPRQIAETVRYGLRPDAGGDGPALPAAEVLAVAVAPAATGRGLGRALVGAAVGAMRVRGVPAVRVLTAVDNVAAIRMYEHAGFRRCSVAEVHRGVPQQVLVWS